MFIRLGATILVLGFSNLCSAQSYNANGVPHADQFPGADMCAQLRAANMYAITNNTHLVDATQYTGTQSCSVDPFQGLLSNNTAVNLTDLLGAVHIQTTVELHITNNGFTLKGVGPAATWIEYTGTAQISEILKIQSGSYVSDADSPTSNIDGIAIEDLAIMGTNSNALNAIQITGAKQPYLSNVNTWGVTGSGYSCNFVISPTFYRLRTSAVQASALGYPGPTPAHEFYFGGTKAGATTDGTVVDAAAEYLTGVGWWLAQTESMVFTSGTSESNAAGLASGSPGGIEIDQGSNHNSFLNTDVEGNGGDSVVDNGANNKFFGVIALDGLGIVAGSTSQFSQASTTTGGLAIRGGAQFADYRRGGEISTIHSNGGQFYNGGGFGWNAARNGELDYDVDVSVGPFAHLFRTPGQDGSYNNLGGFQSSGGVVANGQAVAAGGAAPNAVVFGNETETTVGPAGSASPLPSAPTGYLVFFLGNQRYRLPYYNY